MKNFLLLLFTFLLISCTKSPRFELLSSRHTGIDFKNTIAETDSFNIMTYEYIYNGAGVGIGDLNNDGWQDIVFAGNQVSPGVYLNKGKFKFKDIASNFEIGDVNKDGYPDIYITNDYNSNDLLYINQRDGTFRNEIRKYLSYQTHSSMGNDMADVNNDGDLDYVVNNLNDQAFVLRNNN